MNKPLQLINPTAKAYVTLTPTLVSPESNKNKTIIASPSLSQHSQHSQHHGQHGQHGQHSQHTLHTLAGGKYYDEYDEDDDSSQLIPPSSSNQASFPPSNQLQQQPQHQQQQQQHHQHQHHQQQHKRQNHIIDLTHHHFIKKNHSPPSSPNRLASSSSSSVDHPIQIFNTHRWRNLSEQRPLLAFSIGLAIILLASALILAALVWYLLPPLNQKDWANLRIPTSFDALKKLNALLQIYKTENYYRVLSSFVLIYLFLQAFSLPGSMYLSILAGAMFGVQVALPVVSLCVGTGAMLCYLMSLNLASNLVTHSPCLRTRLDAWRIKLSTKTNKFDLFSYLVVIRISPLPPHWVVNLLAPHVGIQLGLFWFTTCIGILPVTLIHTQLGTTLDQMVGPEDLSFLTTKNLTGLSLVAIGVLIPVLIRWYLKQDSQDSSNNSLSATTFESRPFSTRSIRLSLDNNHNDHHHDFITTTPRRPNTRLRSLSTQTSTSTANSSFSSLNKLARIDSAETLLLSSHRQKSPPTSFSKSSSHYHHLPLGLFSKSSLRNSNQVLINHNNEDDDKALLLETKLDSNHHQELDSQQEVFEDKEGNGLDDSIEGIKFKKNLLKSSCLSSSNLRRQQHQSKNHSPIPNHSILIQKPPNLLSLSASSTSSNMGN